jgi:dTDP-4-dehydrorhamnose reductase
LRSALGAQFLEHKNPVLFLEPDRQLAPDFFAADEPALVIDCLGVGGNPDFNYLSEDFFAQLIAACRESEWPWLMLSDSRVFPSLGKQRFGEVDTPAPNSVAGERLLWREHYISENLPRHILLRVGPIIAAQGLNLLTHLLQQLRGGGVVSAPGSPRFCPTPAADIARIISAIHDQLDCAAECWGTYHYQSSDITNHYEFAEVLLAAATQYWNIGSDHVQLQAAAIEPFGGMFPLLNCQRIRDSFGIQQLPWRKAIPAILKQIYTGA